MPNPPWTPQFRARLTFQWGDLDGAARSFTFAEDGILRTPMLMDGFEGMSSVAIHSPECGPFSSGDTIEVSCRVVAKTFFEPIVAPGVVFELHDGGFFARGVVTERVEEGWA